MIRKTRRAAMAGRAAVGLLALASVLAGCADRGGGRSHASSAALAACRQRADQVYERQNRGAIYQADTYATGARDSPFSGAGLQGDVTAGLAGQYHRQQLEDDCLAGTDGTTPNGPVAVAPAGAAGAAGAAVKP